PLFSLDGKLLGNNNVLANPYAKSGSGHTSVEYFGRAYDDLLAGRHVRREGRAAARSPEPPVDPRVGPLAGLARTEEFRAKVHKSVITVLEGDSAVALGLVVDQAGWAVTKSSELPADKVTCKLSDGRTLEATIAGRDRDHDLALLKLSAGAAAV